MSGDGDTSAAAAENGSAKKSTKVTITTLGEVLQGFEALGRLSKQSVSVNVAQKIMELIREAKEKIISFEKSRDVLSGEMGTPTELENQWTIPHEKLGDFRSAIDDMTREEVRFPIAKCLTFAELSEAKISAEDLENLSYLVLDME